MKLSLNDFPHLAPVPTARRNCKRLQDLMADPSAEAVKKARQEEVVVMTAAREANTECSTT